MRVRTKLALVFSLFCFAIFQTAVSIWTRGVWPVPAAFMYAFVPRVDQVKTHALDLIQDDGKRKRVRPGAVLQLESWRARHVINEMLHEESMTSEAERAEFSRLLLTYANSERWLRFDEMVTPAHPDPGHQFVGLDLVGVTYGKPGGDLRLDHALSIEHIEYTYRESGR